MNKTQANRFTDMYNMLANLDKKHKFNILSWTDAEQINKRNGHKLTEKEVVGCGTTCCAVGWAALMLPSWNQFSLKNLGHYPELHFKNNLWLKDVEDAEELYLHLGITEDEFDDLFLGEYYVNAFSPIKYYADIKPKHVMKKIKDVLDSYGWELVD